MSENNEIQSRFVANVAKHEMLVCLDNGVHRHLRFRDPKDYAHWFDIVTWSHHLSVAGDMGTFVFSRCNDMFHFFRAKRRDFGASVSRAMKINPSYWAEKLEAAPRGGYQEFSTEVFEAAVRHRFNEFCDDTWPEDEDEGDVDSIMEGVDGGSSRSEKMSELWEGIKNQVLLGVDNERDAYEAMDDFTWNGKSVFGDVSETEFNDYTYHYLWICHAIVWAIGQYDAYRFASVLDIQVNALNTKTNYDEFRELVWDNKPLADRVVFLLDKGVTAERIAGEEGESPTFAAVCFDQQLPAGRFEAAADAIAAGTAWLQAVAQREGESKAA